VNGVWDASLSGSSARSGVPAEEDLAKSGEERLQPRFGKEERKPGGGLKDADFRVIAHDPKCAVDTFARKCSEILRDRKGD